MGFGLRLRQRLACWLLDGVHLRGVSFGTHSIELSPVGAGDVARWSGSQDPASAGDLGMDVSSGRARLFVGGAADSAAVLGDLDVATGLDTTGIGAGDVVYETSVANTVAKTSSAAIATARFFGVGTAVSGTVQRNGAVICKMTTAGGSPTNGQPVYLAAAADDGATGSGKLTATRPTAGVAAEVGICEDNGDYAGMKTSLILLQPKSPKVFG